MARDADSSLIRAAGFVLYRREGGGLRYLLLTNARHGGIGVPKGKASKGEDDLVTALRETEEETGLGPDRVEPNPWFERTVRYPLGDREKEVRYLLAATGSSDVRLSSEHSACAWLGLDEALATVRHETLRDVLRDAATFLKDPALRRGLAPADARAMLEARVEERVVTHTAQVADMARRLADPLDQDADFVEACAWVHDIGRAVDHPRHPLEGFRLMAAEGYGGYAPPCISHYTKGRPRDECGPMADELWRACDLSTFEPFERLVALADFMAAGDRRVTIDERHADLCERYGRSPFIDGSLEIARRLKEEWEDRTGLGLYAQVQ